MRIDTNDSINMSTSTGTETSTETHDIQTLLETIQLLETKVQTLELEKMMMTEQISEMKTHMEIFQCCKPLTFSQDVFKRVANKVEYLQMCSLDYTARSALFNANLDFPCSKYLIDCYDQGLYNLNEVFNVDINSYNLLLMITARGCYEAIVYILDICVRKNLDMEYLIANKYGRSTKYTSLLNLCSNRHPTVIDNYSILMNRMLDIYVERNLNIFFKSTNGWTIVHLVSHRGNLHLVKRVVQLHNTQIRVLKIKTDDGLNCLQIACLYGHMEVIRFMIDIFVEKNFDLECVNKKDNRTLIQLLDSNKKLKNKTLQMYLNSLERNVYTF